MPSEGLAGPGRAERERERLSRPREYLCLYLGLGFLGLECLVWLPFAALLHLLLPAAIGQRVGRRVIRFGFALYLRWLSLLGACRFDVSALDGLADEGPLIIAPNHPCLLDAVMVIACLPNVACIMKAGLMNNIFLGAAARLAGYIRNEPTLAMVLSSVTELEKGGQLLLFPEGTRTVNDPINPCLPSAAIISGRSGVPIQTVLIETDSAYLAKGWPLFRRPDMPIRYRLRLGERFAPDTDHEALTHRLETYLAGAMRASDMKPPAAPASQA
ncbi:MAG: 1-acyl-sn-glycerol-3-phosphate acyltransferase [Rhodocyclaceae bacterium]|nr:1-acyl-sn-glycerol-3-phosphate acyltransferase [Rhodocyclaceae bacterium]